MEGKGQSRAAKRRKKQAAKTGHSQPQLSAPKAAAPLPSSQQQQQQVKKQKPSRAESAAGRPLMEIVRDGSLQGKEKASQLLAQLIAPTTLEASALCVERTFYETHWEQAPLHVRRGNPRHYGDLFSRATLERLTREQSLVYGEDIDVTLYENGVRHTLNPTPEPRSSNGAGEDDGSEASPGIVAEHQDLWNHFSNGCSLRMLCPQKFDDNIWKLLSGLEDEFNCMVGCNVYLTPAGSQGFAPHYDDIEAFVLQLEGKKHWRIYSPKESEILPRYSSANFSQDEIGKPLMEVTLEPGDLLYFPRGFIHQAVTVGDKASLHLTVSTAQLNSYADLLETCVPQAVASVIESSIAIRKSLPADYLEYLGVAASDNDDDHRRKMFKATLRTMLMQVVEECVDMIDATADQMAKKFIVQRLPPPISEEDEEKMDPDTPIRPDSMLRVVKKGVARVMVEDGKVVVYHCMDNARVLYGAEFAPLEFELDDGPAIEMLLNAYPDPVRVHDLPHPPNEDIEDKIGIAESLFKERLLVLVGNSTDNPGLLAKNGGKPAKRSRLSSHGVESDHDDDDNDEDYGEDDQQDEAEEDDDAPW